MRDWLISLRTTEVIKPIQDTLTGWESKIDNDLDNLLR